MTRPFVESSRTPQDAIQVGQVWYHHSISGGYIVEYVDRPSDGRVSLRKLDDGRGYAVWPSYLLSNFTLASSRSRARDEETKP